MRQLKVALLAYGMSGKVFHAPFLELHPGFELVGAWERSKKLINADFPSVKSYKSLADLLDDDCDLVIVNTPVDTHFEYAKAALIAGKHVLVEKAFTTTSAEAEELRDLAFSQNRVLSIFHNRRWDSDFRTVEDMCRKNVLGNIIEAEIRFERFRPELSAKRHKEMAAPGAGILMDLGPHIIDQALCLFGFPDEISADIRTTRYMSVVDDWFDLTLFYPKFRVRLKAGFFAREPLPAYTLYGEKGS
ncbi:MAG: Gfo/Idh/MocA family oxidoreductase, partial [Flavobacterium sp.]|nr:Gfo/Idh/MocA family oxidoreductase [Flavobacterium sp.]